MAILLDISRSPRLSRSIWSICRRSFASDSQDARRTWASKEWPPMDITVPPAKPRPAVPLEILPTIGPKDQYYKSLQDPDYFRVSDMFTVRQLMDARIHFGHKIGTLEPKMTPFLLGERLGVCIFDLDQTAFHLRQALNFIAHVAYRGGIITFFGGDRWNIHAIEKAAKEVGEYSHCRRFNPGTFQNSQQTFGNVIRYPDLGIFCSTRDSVFSQHKAIAELSRLCIPIVSVVDSNCDPNLITYPIPGNDDSMVSIRFYLQLFKDAIRRGKEKANIDFSRIEQKDQRAAKAS